MSVLSDSLTTVSLEDFLEKSEIENLKKYPSFSEDYYEKKVLILKFISLAIESFEKIKENMLSKCFKWVKKELQENLEIAPDRQSILKFESYENEPSMRMSLGWIKEYSSLSKATHIYSMINSMKSRKVLHKSKLSYDLNSFTEIEEPPNEKLVKRNSININFINGGLYKKFIKINEQQIDDINFNIFEFSEIVGRENILPVISIYVLNTNSSFDIIPYNKFEKYIYEIANAYHKNNPYHTDLHAGDMVQTLFVYNIHTKFQQIFDMTDLEIICMFVAAMVHDVRHPGFSNNYLININDPIAIEYNDKSVLENYHVSQAFEILRSNPECNFFSGFLSDDYKLCRKNIIEYVLHTDMTLHNQQFKSFKLKLETYNIKKGQNIEKLFDETDPIANYKMKMEFISFLIHSADVSNPTKPLEVYKIWAKRCLDECLLQGDCEKERGLNVSFNCDRNTVSLSRFQLGFINGIVFPLFTVLNEYFPQLSFTLDNIKENSEYFKNSENDNEKKK